MKPLILISPWFGPWPSWINFFAESCRLNPEIDWLIPTDQDPPENRPGNIRYLKTSFDEYKESSGDILGIDLSGLLPYKICDLKPCLGLIHEADIKAYGSFGFCDIDVIFGDLRGIYDDNLLSDFDAISTHPDRISGHLAVFRNTPRMRNYFRGVEGWQDYLESSKYIGMDEDQFARLFRSRGIRRLIRKIIGPRALFLERYTTPGGDIVWPDGGLGPSEWRWQRGKLSHERGGERSIYLHVMFWHSDRWRKPESGRAPWPMLDRVVHCDWREAAELGFTISPRGIELLQSSNMQREPGNVAERLASV